MEKREVIITYRQDFNRNFTKFLSANELTDVEISASDGKIRAHRVLLATSSKYFRQLFNVKPAELGEYGVRDLKFYLWCLSTILSFPYSCYKENVNLPNIPINITKSIIALIYSGRANVPLSKIDDFVKAAKFLQLVGFDTIDPKTDLIYEDDSDSGESLASCKTNTSIGKDLVDERSQFTRLDSENVKIKSKGHSDSVKRSISSMDLMQNYTYSSLTDASSSRESSVAKDRASSACTQTNPPSTFFQSTLPIIFIIVSVLSSLYVIHQFCLEQ